MKLMVMKMVQHLLLHRIVVSWIAAMDLLIEAGANIMITNNDELNALHTAAGKDQDQAIIKLLELGFEINRVNSTKKTALMLAAFFGQCKAVKMLITHGADLFLQDEDGRTALIEAAEYGHQEIVQQLVEATPSEHLHRLFMIQDTQEKTAFDYAIERCGSSSEVTLYLQEVMETSGQEILKHKRAKHAL
jgi:ankyrin repeat protein